MWTYRHACVGRRAGGEDTPLEGVKEVVFPICTTCGPLVKKTRIQVHRGGLMCRQTTVTLDEHGENGEIEDRNEAGEYNAHFGPFLARMERAVWRASAIASSVNLFGL